jgi:hypothetical protein
VNAHVSAWAIPGFVDVVRDVGEFGDGIQMDLLDMIHADVFVPAASSLSIAATTLRRNIGAVLLLRNQVMSGNATGAHFNSSQIERFNNGVRVRFREATCPNCMSTHNDGSFDAAKMRRLLTTFRGYNVETALSYNGTTLPSVDLRL